MLVLTEIALLTVAFVVILVIGVIRTHLCQGR
jgi:hypothetical protein